MRISILLLFMFIFPCLLFSNISNVSIMSPTSNTVLDSNTLPIRVQVETDNSGTDEVVVIGNLKQGGVTRHSGSSVQQTIPPNSTVTFEFEITGIDDGTYELEVIAISNNNQMSDTTNEVSIDTTAPEKGVLLFNFNGYTLEINDGDTLNNLYLKNGDTFSFRLYFEDAHPATIEIANYNATLTEISNTDPSGELQNIGGSPSQYGSGYIVSWNNGSNTNFTCDNSDTGVFYISINLVDSLGHENTFTFGIQIDNDSPAFWDLKAGIYFDSGMLVREEYYENNWTRDNDVVVYSPIYLYFDEPVLISDEIGMFYFYDTSGVSHIVTVEIEAIGTSEVLFNGEEYSQVWMVSGDFHEGTSNETESIFSNSGETPDYWDGNTYYYLLDTWTAMIRDRAGNTGEIDGDFLFHTEFLHPTIDFALVWNSLGAVEITDGSDEFFEPNINLRIRFNEQMDLFGLKNNLFISMYDGGTIEFIPLTTDETLTGIDLDGDGSDDATLDNIYFLNLDGKTIVDLDFNDDMFIFGGTYTVKIAGLKPEYIDTLEVDSDAQDNSFTDNGATYRVFRKGACNLAGDVIFTKEFTFRILKDAPNIINIEPLNDANDVDISNKIRVFFNVPMDINDMVTGAVRLFKGEIDYNNEIIGSISYSYNTSENVLIFSPTSPLAYDSDYIFVVNPSLRSTWEIPLSESYPNDNDLIFHFKTRRAIDIDNTPLLCTEEIISTTEIRVYFNKPLDVSTIRNNIELIELDSNNSVLVDMYYTGEIGGTNELIIKYNQPLTYGKDYLFRILNDLTDIYGIYFDGNASRAGLQVYERVFVYNTNIFYRPTVLNVIPYDGEIVQGGEDGVRTIEIEFDIPMDVNSVKNEISLYLLGDEGSEGEFSIERVISNNTGEIFYVIIRNPLPYSAEIGLFISRNCTSQDGINMIDDHIVTFNTNIRIPVDNVSPTVDFTFPTNNARSISPSSKIYIIFDEAMDETTINSENIIVESLGRNNSETLNIRYEYFYTYEVFSNERRYVAVLTPYDVLPIGTDIRVTIKGDGPKDLSGNGFDGDILSEDKEDGVFIFSVTDAVAPAIIEVSPQDGSIDVATNEVITITFNTTMDTGEVNSVVYLISETGEVINVISGGPRWESYTYIDNGLTRVIPDAKLIFTPEVTLHPGTAYTVIVDDSARDIYGNRLDRTYTFDFTTTYEYMTNYPHVTGSNPLENSNNVPYNIGEIRVSFSEAMSGEVLNTTSVRLYDSSSNEIAISNIEFTDPSTSNEIRVYLGEILDGNETYILVISGEVTSINGDQLDGNRDGAPGDDYTLIFTTNDSTSNVGSDVISHVIPPNGAVGVMIDAIIRVFFNSSNNASHTILLYKGAIGSGNLVSGEVSYNNIINMLSFTPSTDLEYNTTYIFVVDGLYQYSFTTEQDNTPPQVLGIDANPNIDAAFISSEIRVRFSEPMDPLSINGNTILLKLGDSRVLPCNISYDNTSNEAIINATPSLVNGTTYKIVVKSACKDVNGNTLLNDVEFTLKTVDNTAGYALEAFPQPGNENTLLIYVETPAGLSNANDALKIWQMNMNDFVGISLSPINPTRYSGSYVLNSNYPGLGIVRLIDGNGVISFYFTYNLINYESHIAASPDRNMLLSFSVKDKEIPVFLREFDNPNINNKSPSRELVQVSKVYSVYSSDGADIHIIAERQNGAGIYKYNNSSWVMVSNGYDGNAYISNDVTSGRFAIFRDVLPPRLIGVAKRLTVRKLEDIRFRVEEMGSGIHRGGCFVYLNGVRNNIIIKDDGSIELPFRMDNGEHLLEFELADRAGNVRRYSPIKLVVNLPLNITRFELFPNPAIDEVGLTVEFSTVVDSAKLILYDTSGKRVKTYYFNASSGIIDEVLQLNNYRGYPLANGVYFYRFICEGNGRRILRSGKITILK